MFNDRPLRRSLSGLRLEYRIIQIYSRDSGKREASISFNVGQGTQDLGFRSAVDILFTCDPAVSVVLDIRDARRFAEMFRRLWIVRVNAACKMRDISYSRFIYGLQKVNIELDRKSLSEIAIFDPATFDQLVTLAKSQLEPVGAAK